LPEETRVIFTSVETQMINIFRRSRSVLCDAASRVYYTSEDTQIFAYKKPIYKKKNVF
jgi:hypothetical protein